MPILSGYLGPRLRPLTSAVTGGLAGGFSAPSSLFLASDPGYWYDNNDTATLFQDVAGKQPVTTAGQSVALRLDKRLPRGVNLLAALDLSQAPWATNGGVTALTANSITTSGIGGRQAAGIMQTGHTYEVVCIFTKSNATAEIRLCDGLAANNINSSTAASGTLRAVFTCAGDGSFYFRMGAAATVTITSMSLQEVAGNHCTQATAGSRPIYEVDANGRGRLNWAGSKYMEIASSTGAFKFLHDGTGGMASFAAALASPLTAGVTAALAASSTVGGVGVGASFWVAEETASNTATVRFGTTIGNGTATVINGGVNAAGATKQDGSPQVYSASFKTQTGSDSYIYSDGDSFSVGRGSAATPSTSAAAANWKIGTDGTNYWPGVTYDEVVIGRVLTDQERKNLLRYQRGLYGDTGFFIAAGDSHTFLTTYGVYMQSQYPARIEAALRAGGQKLASLNYGVAGNSTGEVVNRMGGFNEAGTPAFAIIYAGQNDALGTSTVQASPAPTTTTFSVGAGKGTRYAAGAVITVGAESAVVLSVATDAITLEAPLSGAPSAGASVTIDTVANLKKVAGYLRAAGVGRLLMCGSHYMNWATGGDTVATPAATYATLRALQTQAASEAGAVYVDLHGYMRALIVAGTYTQGDDTAWHAGVGNTHLNAVGQQILANAIFAAVQAQGWA